MIAFLMLLACGVVLCLQMLRFKSKCVEDVDSARKYIEMLPTKLAELMADVEAYKVGLGFGILLLKFWRWVLTC